MYSDNTIWYANINSGYLIKYNPLMNNCRKVLAEERVESVLPGMNSLIANPILNGQP